MAGNPGYLFPVGRDEFESAMSGCWTEWISDRRAEDGSVDPDPVVQATALALYEGQRPADNGDGALIRATALMNSIGAAIQLQRASVK